MKSILLITSLISLTLLASCGTKTETSTEVIVDNTTQTQAVTPPEKFAEWTKIEGFDATSQAQVATSSGTVEVSTSTVWGTPRLPQ